MKANLNCPEERKGGMIGLQWSQSTKCKIASPNQSWLGEITHVLAREFRFYLRIVMDLFKRKVWDGLWTFALARFWSLMR